MKFLSVNMVLAAFTLLERLLKSIQLDRDRRSLALGDQIEALRQQQAEVTNESIRASRVARKISELTS